MNKLFKLIDYVVILGANENLYKSIFSVPLGNVIRLGEFIEFWCRFDSIQRPDQGIDPEASERNAPRKH